MHSDSFTLIGTAYLAGSSRQISARLDVAPCEGERWLRLVGQGDDEFSRAPLNEVTVQAALGRTARKLIFSDGTVFETADHTGFARLDEGSPSMRLHMLERFGPHLIAFAIACLGAAYLLWRYGLDILAALAVVLTPQLVVEKIDIGALRTIDFAMAQPSNLDDMQKQRARAIYDQLLSALPVEERQEHGFTLLFRSMPDVGPNAFALPGGTMVLTDELLKTFPNENVIAAIIGHEIGHVVQEHGLRRLYRSLSAYVLIALLAGDTGPILEDILLEGSVLLSLSYDRAQETAADEFGLTLSHRADFDPNGLKEFFERLAHDMGNRNIEWMSTHPSHEKRIKAIDRFVEGLQ